jgi:YVTN family beta-propeller protein
MDRWFPPACLFSTRGESLALVSLSLAAGGLLIAGQTAIAFLGGAIVWLLLGYRFGRRKRAARRLGVEGFVLQAPPVSLEKYSAKLDPLNDVFGAWEPGLRWLRQYNRHIEVRNQRERPRRALIVLGPVALLLVVTALAWGDSGKDKPAEASHAQAADDTARRPKPEPRSQPATQPRSPPATREVYRHTHAGMLSASTKDDLERIYVPNSDSDTVSVIDPGKAKVVDTFAVGDLPHHVTPSHDLETFYVNSTRGNGLLPIDPETGKPKGRQIPVDDPYNLYFTPDGRSAIVVAERLGRLDFRDPRTWKLRKSVPTGCVGVDHMDFTADGRGAVASCEFDGTLLLVDLGSRKVVRRLRLDRPGAKPVDVRLSPDGKLFYVADEVANGVWRVDAHRLRVKNFIPTGPGTHGLYPSRDASVMYATNRLGGTVSVIDLKTGKVRATWRIPGGGSPDMGGVSANGKLLWLSGRYHAEVYAIGTADGKLRARIPVAPGAHGMLVWPQPGRYSLGHTGNMR